jgi:hypothetical protein
MSRHTKYSLCEYNYELRAIKMNIIHIYDSKIIYYKNTFRN